MEYKNAKSLNNLKPEEIAISLEHVTKDYGRGRGLFDVNLVIPKGKVFGYCGTNGAGKTTTLRHIMGFIRPDKGKVTVYGMDAWKKSEEIKKLIGYLPGEIAFPPLENGTEFLKLQATLLNVSDMSRAEEVINAMQLDPTANLKRMSKGMKQKTAMAACFMARQPILVMDEPTTGLDPLMRESFINLIKEEKAKGTTIIMSNHMFDELEETCDYVAFIKDGKIIDVVDMNEIHARPFREYKVGFYTKEDWESADTSQVEVLSKNPIKFNYVVRVPLSKTNGMIREFQKHNLRYVHEVQYTLEKYFMENVVGGNYDE